ncbi:hypothetical protein ABGB12_03475 [Actinocorallia sp. B10E7]|uniref:hypothetical protein n=1 Tax=Actinocorallia sp. B10E7 TaxID=3153558 RepID=UPI00325E23A2
MSTDEPSAPDDAEIRLTMPRGGDALTRLQAEHPGWRIFRSRKRDGRAGDDWVASRRDVRAGIDPTVICRSAEELRQALREQARRAQGPVLPDPAALDLPGWTVTVEEGWLFAEARRSYSLYQWMAGAQNQASARSVEELHILCDAYDALTEALIRAERTHRAWFEATRSRCGADRPQPHTAR